MGQATQQPYLDIDQFIKRYEEKLAVAASLAQSVTPDTPLFLEGVSNYSNLQTLEHKGYKDCVTPITPVTSKNDKVQDFTLETFEERAAIIQYNDAIPRCWAIAIAKIQLRSRPNSIAQEKWQEIQSALEMLTTCLKDVIAHGWKISDIFGCHPIAPQRRFDAMGLLMLLNEGDRIIEINNDAIRVQNLRGGTQSFYRPYYRYLYNQKSCLHEI
jgi:hypothetical protein